MKSAAAAMILAVTLAGLTSSAALIVGPALPGHRTEPWVSTQPQNLAFVTGFRCNAAAKRQRDIGTPVPPGCVNRAGFNGLLPPPGDGA